jgi:uracil-DNA glycosylase
MRLTTKCTRCPSLCSSRRRIVWGEWCQQIPAHFRCIMLIGEAPGWQEDASGRPFIGMTGQEVRQSLWRVGLAPHTFLTNIIKCHPKDDRDPTPEELDNCQGWLAMEVERINPVFIITAGRYSSRWALGRDDLTMEMITGIPYHSPVLDRPVLPMIHPAAGFHSQKNLCWVMEAFKVAGELWKQMIGG